MLRPLQVVRELAAIPPYHRSLDALEANAIWEKVAYGRHPRQYMLHAAQADPYAPVVVYFHGGGWQFGSPEKLAAFGEYFYRRGYTVWMPSHRRVPQVTGRAILADAFHAVRAVRDHHVGRGYPARLLLAGMSSGGHLAALCALRQNDWRGNASAGSVGIEGLLCCGSPLSLAHIGRSPTRFRFAGKPRTSNFDLLDPTTQLQIAPDYPAVIIHGTRDGLVPFVSSVAFVSKARKLGWEGLRFIGLPGGSHLDAAAWIYE